MATLAANLASFGNGGRRLTSHGHPQLAQCSDTRNPNGTVRGVPVVVSPGESMAGRTDRLTEEWWLRFEGVAYREKKEKGFKAKAYLRQWPGA